jgi:hypothetical protein
LTPPMHERTLVSEQCGCLLQSWIEPEGST